jgi:hypothetical protein
MADVFDNWEQWLRRLEESRADGPDDVRQAQEESVATADGTSETGSHRNEGPTAG